MTTPRSHVKRPLSSALALATPSSASSASRLSATSKATPPPPNTAARLARCYPPDPAVYQSAVRCFYRDYRQVAAVWRQCNVDCTAAVQSMANGWLQLAEQCGAAGADWGVFAQQPAVRQAVERETQKQIHSASEAATRCMADLLDCYTTLAALAHSLHSGHDDWLNAAVLSVAGVESSEQQTDERLSCPLFDRGSCSFSDFLPMADELLAMHRKELTLKQSMLAHTVEIAAQSATTVAGGSVSDVRAVLEQYLSCWTLEPFLQAERIEHIARVWQTDCPAVATGSST